MGVRLHDLSDAATIWQALVQQEAMRVALLAVRRRRVRHVFGSWIGRHVPRFPLGGTSTMGSHAGKFTTILDHANICGTGNVLRVPVLPREHLHDYLDCP